MAPLVGFNGPLNAQALLYDVSAPSRLMRSVYIASASTVIITREDGTNSGSTTVAWATGDTITIAGTYEAA